MGRMYLLFISYSTNKEKNMKIVKEINIKVVGEGKRNILVIGESSSSYDIQRELFLKNIELLVDCHCIAVPTLRGNKKEWKVKLDEKIAELLPNHILLFGEKALKIFYSDRLVGLGIATYHGEIIPDRKHRTHVCPLFDPIEVDCSNNQNLSSVANRDLQKVINHLNTFIPSIPDPAEFIEIILDFNEVKAKLIHVLSTDKLIAYDYETTGLNPYISGHKIVSIGVATSRTHAFSFPFQHKYWNKKQIHELEDLWKKVLLKQLKVAHNINFENLWENVLLKISPNNVVWDTMVTAHILDTRSGNSASPFVGLKHQAFIRYGVEDYNKEAKKYIEADESGFNRMEEMPLDENCLYVGTDALVTYWLYRDQRREVALRDLNEANDLFLEGIKAFLDAKMNGIRLDVDYYLEMEQKAVDELKIIDEKIAAFEEISLFEEKYEPINFNSVKHLRILFYDMLKLTPKKLTKKKAPSVDAESLKEIEHPLAELIVEQRKLLKIKNTYIGQILRENVDGYMHPSFLLHRCTSLRSSSAGPNFQNFPNHDLKAKRMVRGGILPDPGHHFVELDYSSAEVKTAACVTGDPILTDYVLDELTDMHRDQAQEIWVTDKISKPMRQSAKNELVFPQVYKAWFGTCANMLWNTSQKLKLTDGISVLDHLRTLEINTFKQFKKHIEAVCSKFWDRFPVLKMWQNQMIVEYQNTGVIKTVTGFQCTSVMTDNMICNYPIQGPSFHCLLWSQIQLNRELKKEFKKRNLESKIKGQIHDSLILSIPPNELKIVLPLARKIMTDEMKAAFPWVSVPFKVDLELADVDRPWSEKKDANWEDYEK